jgi:hypothetical protein
MYNYEDLRKEAEQLGRDVYRHIVSVVWAKPYETVTDRDRASMKELLFMYSYSMQRITRTKLP